MSEKTENQSNGLDMFKWVIVFALLAGLVTANTMYGEISVLYRAIAAVVVVAISGFLAASTVKGSTFLSFAKESRTEVRKVVWPTRQEANQTTLIVLAATAVMSLILWGLDGIIVRLVSFVTGIGA
ncbi:preprotein translocase subunit SecE [Alteromonas sp. 345S023]|uniref:Protein translocase subunit SecE n=1 Tax=Alteromonas profundi TaxID=2696062 RepID=A0A7X5LN72_9ALTE|nr:preprotein translocase subunit SecE [Alteromonas profundi]NDV92439.1 preprotein translocase subunit SecE [Alteromonas profundi]